MVLGQKDLGSGILSQKEIRYKIAIYKKKFSHLSYIATRCLRVCLFVAYLLRNGWTDFAKLFLLAPSWSRDGFRPKKFRIRDPVFPKIRKKTDFGGKL